AGRQRVAIAIPHPSGRVIANFLFERSYRAFIAARATPLRAQAARLRAVLVQAERSDIGRRAGFAGIGRIADAAAMIRSYQDAVPVRTYAAMQEELDAVYAGEWQRLCPSRPVFFAMTAGSTGRFKYVPVTREFRRELRESSMVFSGAMQARYPAVRHRKVQFLVGSAEGGVSPTGIPQGFASGFNYKNFPWLVRRRFTVPYWVFTIEDVEERNYAAGRILVSERRLGALCAISPVNLINLRQTLERHADRLCADIAAGTLDVRGGSAVRGTFSTHPDASLAAALRTARHRGDRLPTSLLFPALVMLVCWRGGNMGYSLDELDSEFGVAGHLEFPVSASEGVFAIPDRPNQTGGTLAITSNFMEFVRDSDAGSGASRALRADELEVGAEYRIVVTNSGGLYRYDMEDIVRVSDIAGCTPVIEFVSKAGRRTSVSNERLTELDVTHAMQATSRACGRWFHEFLFVPCSDRRYRVVFDGAELGGPDAMPRDRFMPALTAELERQLRAAATGYAFEREDALLEPLQVVVTAPGQLAEYLRAAQGPPSIPSAQIKPVRLTIEFDLHRRFAIESTYAA
ncbi:MAG: GH3 auxin-responsive promoter family protein, partial [Candidatus Eisenbacteria bacterium]